MSKKKWRKLGEVKFDENGNVVIEVEPEKFEDIRKIFEKAAKKRQRAVLIRSSHR